MRFELAGLTPGSEYLVKVNGRERKSGVATTDKVSRRFRMPHLGDSNRRVKVEVVVANDSCETSPWKLEEKMTYRPAPRRPPAPGRADSPRRRPVRIRARTHQPLPRRRRPRASRTRRRPRRRLIHPAVPKSSITPTPTPAPPAGIGARQGGACLGHADRPVPENRERRPEAQRRGTCADRPAVRDCQQHRCADRTGRTLPAAGGYRGDRLDALPPLRRQAPRRDPEPRGKAADPSESRGEGHGEEGLGPPSRPCQAPAPLRIGPLAEKQAEREARRSGPPVRRAEGQHERGGVGRAEGEVQKERKKARRARRKAVLPTFDPTDAAAAAAAGAEAGVVERRPAPQGQGGPSGGPQVPAPQGCGDREAGRRGGREAGS